MGKTADIVKEYREKEIKGKLIDFKPLSEEYLQDVVDIRNQDRNKYYLNQPYDLTLDGQKTWFKKYLEKDDDIYWCIFKKDGTFIGTVRLYDVSEEKKILDHGSFMIYENYASEAPYAVEALLISLDFAFDKFQVEKVINEDKADNKVMNNLTRKAGFTFIKDYLLNGVPYKYYLLYEPDYRTHRQKFTNLIDYWAGR